MTTPKEIFDNDNTRIGTNKEQAVSQIGAVYKFVLSGENGGTWVVNMKDAPGVTEVTATRSVRSRWTPRTLSICVKVVPTASSCSSPASSRSKATWAWQ